MHSTVIAVDLAKDVFEIAIANRTGRILERQRLSRAKFSRFITTTEPATLIIEACGSAHHWGRVATAAGHEVRMLPAQYVAPYRRRHKTDRTDTEALIEAHRCEGIISVPTRSIEQQQVLQVHILREQWKKTRVQRINALRGCLRELGHFLPIGARSVAPRVRALLAEEDLPPALAHIYHEMLEEIEALAARIQNAERTLAVLARNDERVARLQTILGIGPLTATALVASVGNPERFPSARKLASWLGLTPNERSSGTRRRLGSISKQGDGYLRMLIIHGARSVLARSKQQQRDGTELEPLRAWATALERRVGHNKATCALANKLARICWVVWVSEQNYRPRSV